jgi:autotransporter strand-loop-strand O-heptosyltransferase
VLIQIPQGALGDAIAWFSYVERFGKMNKCRLSVAMQPEIACIFAKQYPGIRFITMDEAAGMSPYATYHLGLFFGGDTDGQPFDFREVGLHRAAGHILGLEGDDLADEPPRVDLSAPRRIPQPYAVIATQASSQCKCWNNPSGWREAIAHLKSMGLRVLCIDKCAEYGSGVVFNRIPWGCEDFTGDLPLQERIDLIKDAEVFVGLSSGLSWLAWCCKVPIVMVSGFTDPVNEFHTPYRVQNPRVCHGCWNDQRIEFDHSDFLWCPRKERLEDRFECTKAITARMVNAAIDRAINEKEAT